MKRWYYDLHMHSCLSPCGDNDMTPNNIMGMAQLKELDVIALTDHNTCRNCPALFEAAKDSAVTVLAGMELSTAEEIHIVCLFPDLAHALAFDTYVYARLPDVENREEVFGEQLVLSAQDEIVAHEPKLLINATSISIDEVGMLAQQFGFFAYPAHIDRDSYSILSTFGLIPDEPYFPAVEIAKPDVFFENPRANSLVGDRKTVTSSDAHYLWDIAEREHYFTLESPSFEEICAVLSNAHRA